MKLKKINKKNKITKLNVIPERSKKFPTWSNYPLKGNQVIFYATKM